MAEKLAREDRAVLEAGVRAPTTEQRDVLRARIILPAAKARSARSIVAAVGAMPVSLAL